jgi:hypothetical protein
LAPWGSGNPAEPLSFVFCSGDVLIAENAGGDTGATARAIAILNNLKDSCRL